MSNNSSISSFVKSSRWMKCFFAAGGSPPSGTPSSFQRATGGSLPLPAFNPRVVVLVLVLVVVVVVVGGWWWWRCTIGARLAAANEGIAANVMSPITLPLFLLSSSSNKEEDFFIKTTKKSNLVVKSSSDRILLKSSDLKWSSSSSAKWFGGGGGGRVLLLCLSSSSSSSSSCRVGFIHFFFSALF